MILVLQRRKLPHKSDKQIRVGGSGRAGVSTHLSLQSHCTCWSRQKKSQVWYYLIHQGSRLRAVKRLWPLHHQNNDLTPVTLLLSGRHLRSGFGMHGLHSQNYLTIKPLAKIYTQCLHLQSSSSSISHEFWELYKSCLKHELKKTLAKQLQRAQEVKD